MPYENFNLREWPFRISADEDFASVWAGRLKTKEQLERLLRKIALVPKSGLHIFWANFGMGKTHTLYHMKYRCLQTKGQIIPVYAVMPKRSTGFLELYRAIVQAFLGTAMRDYLGRQLLDVGQHSKSSSVALDPMFSDLPGVVRALLAIRGGDIEATSAAMQWLTAQPGLPASALKSIGVTYRIKTPEDAISALSALLNLAIWGKGNQTQVLLMIDEFQRIGELGTKVVSQINSSLHTIFNAHPTGLQLILTFAFGNRANLDYLLSPELKSRSELQSINLDVLSLEDAMGFLGDLLGQFRIHEDNQRPLYPFSQAAANTMLTTISQHKSLTPRRIMLYANHALTEHMLSSNELLHEITDLEMTSFLSDPHLGEMDTDLEASS